MDKFFTILKTEYLQVVKKKSFLLGVILTPVFMILITMLPALLATRTGAGKVSYAVIDADGRGIGQQLVEDLSRYKVEKDSTLQAYNLKKLYAILSTDLDEVDSLRTYLDSLVQSKELGNYIVIYPQPEITDSVLLVSKSMNFRTTGRFSARVSDILTSLRLERLDINVDIDTMLNMTRRIDLIEESPGGKTRSFLTIYFSALVFVMIMFVTVFSYGQVLMRSVIEEKSSRVMEVLMSSVSPFQLMMGKVFGLGAANLTQVGIWVLMGAVLFAYRGSLSIPEGVGDIVFNPVIITFFVLYILIGYMMFSALFALIGSISSTEKDAQSFVFPITMALMLPVFVLMYIVQEPDSIITTILSLIPILTPTMMIARLNIVTPDSFSLADPMVLEATIGVLLTGAFTIFTVWITARIFRMGVLMYGKRATLPEIMKWVRYK